MNLKYVFFIVSSIACNNIYSSQADAQATPNTQEKTKVTSYLTPPSTEPVDATPSLAAPNTQENTNGTSNLTPPVIKPVDAVPTPSSFLTTVTYGFLKHAGKTDYEIFMDLSKSGTLKADYEKNLNEAFNRFNAAARERFKEKSLLSAQKQAKIANLFTTASGIHSDFVLAKALATEYFTLQKEALENTLKKQADKIEPTYREERNDIIEKAAKNYDAIVQQATKDYNAIVKQADQNYIDHLTNELKHTKDAVSNSRYLYFCAGSDEKYEDQNENHYENIETFTQYLATINPKVEIASDTNLHHLPKTK